MSNDAINLEANVNEEVTENQEDFYERLYALRDMTKLNPIAYAKVLRARKQAEQLRDLYVRYEPNDEIGVDYSVADDLEYSLRKEALTKQVEKSWRGYVATENDGTLTGLDEYANYFITDHIRASQGARIK